MTRFARQIATFIDAEGLLTPGATVITGLSGGADSTALLAVLTELGYHCVAAHCNFGLRGAESVRDEVYSRRIAADSGATFELLRPDVDEYMREKGVSVEMACRDLRYDFFSRLAEKHKAAAIAVGHHREDNVETFFLNLLRGSGIRGLRAMKPKRDNVVRPLLTAGKADILAYLNERGLTYVTDSTNALNDFKRNKIRNVIMPALEECFPGATMQIAESVAYLREQERVFDSLLPPMPDSLTGAEPALIHEWLSPFGFNSDQCKKISRAQSGALFASLDFTLTICPGGKFTLKRRGEQTGKPTLRAEIYPKPENFRPKPGVLYIDGRCADADKFRWELRPWRSGDRIAPFGMRGSKLVSDILAEAGVAASERVRKYVLTINGEIVWAVGHRTSQLYTITENSETVIEIHHEEI